MTIVNQNINCTKREKYFADHFRSIKINSEQNKAIEKISLPSTKDSWWRRFGKFRKSEHEDIEAIANMVAGEDINSKIGHNIAKTTVSASIKTDGGEAKAQSGPTAKMSPGSMAGGSSLGSFVMGLLGRKGNSIMNIVVRELINYAFIPTCIMIGQAILYAFPFVMIVLLMLVAWEEVFGWIEGVADTLGG